MEQMKIDPRSRIEIDYNDWPLTTATQKLQPVVFKEGDSFYCLLGPDPIEGIFGCGTTAYEAVTDSEQQLHDRLASDKPDDRVASYVKDTLKINEQF
jgi:hypothetical protein